MEVHWAAAPSNRNIFTWIVREALNAMSDKIKLKACALIGRLAIYYLPIGARQEKLA